MLCDLLSSLKKMIPAIRAKALALILAAVHAGEHDISGHDIIHLCQPSDRDRRANWAHHIGRDTVQDRSLRRAGDHAVDSHIARAGLERQ